MASTKVPRRPLAFGMWEWAPLPDTKATIVWDGPGSALMFTYPSHATAIRHPTANGVYDTVKQADAAVQAFVAVYLEETASEQPEVGGFGPHGDDDHPGDQAAADHAAIEDGRL
jgi:hypothetical protein